MAILPQQAREAINNMSGPWQQNKHSALPRCAVMNRPMSAPALGFKNYLRSRIPKSFVSAAGHGSFSSAELSDCDCRARLTLSFHCAVKLQAVREPGLETFTFSPHSSSAVTPLCSERNAKFVPTVISVPPSGVTKIE